MDTHNKLIAIGEFLSAGDSLLFCRCDTQTAQEDLLRMLRDIKRRGDRPPKGGVYYSCLRPRTTHVRREFRGT
ncbi:MAG: hypothetical protein ACE10A_08725 [Acidiferrobacterales bacterium]